LPYKDAVWLLEGETFTAIFKIAGKAVAIRRPLPDVIILTLDPS
jgi:hypothetical protein